MGNKKNKSKKAKKIGRIFRNLSKDGKNKRRNYTNIIDKNMSDTNREREKVYMTNYHYKIKNF